MLRSMKPKQVDEGEFESVFDVDSIKYQMVTELVQVRWLLYYLLYSMLLT